MLIPMKSRRRPLRRKTVDHCDPFFRQSSSQSSAMRAWILAASSTSVQRAFSARSLRPKLKLLLLLLPPPKALAKAAKIRAISPPGLHDTSYTTKSSGLPEASYQIKTDWSLANQRPSKMKAKSPKTIPPMISIIFLFLFSVLIMVLATSIENMFFIYSIVLCVFLEILFIISVTDKFNFK